MKRLAAAMVALALTGCGGADEPQLTVSAASSLRDALTSYAKSFDGAAVRLSFAGSDALAAQIRAGVRPDVFVSADRGIAAKLHADGLAGAPRVVGTNSLVLAIRADAPDIHRLQDLARPGVTLALGSPSVPAPSSIMWDQV